MSSPTTSNPNSTYNPVRPQSSGDSSGGNQFFDTLAGKPMVLIGAFLALIALAAGIIAFMNQKNAKSDAANNALYQAQKSLETEMKAFAASVAPPPAVAAKDKDKKAPVQPSATSPESVMFKKTDVDARFPEAVKKLQGVSTQYAGTRAAFEAELALGSLYNQHGEPSKSIGWFEKAVAAAPKSFDKALALSSLGYALEGSQKYAEAVAAYQKALNLGEAGLKGELLLSVARNQELMGDKAKAQTTYDQVITQLPGTEQARSAELLKSQLQ